MRAAAGVLGDGLAAEGTPWRSTVEPCNHVRGCFGAGKRSRGVVMFGAWEPKRRGGSPSLWDRWWRDRRVNHRPEVRGGVLAQECAAPLAAFFARQDWGLKGAVR